MPSAYLRPPPGLEVLTGVLQTLQHITAAYYSTLTGGSGRAAGYHHRCRSPLLACGGKASTASFRALFSVLLLPDGR